MCSKVAYVWLLFNLTVTPLVGLEGEQQWTEHTVLWDINAQSDGGGLFCFDYALNT